MTLHEAIADLSNQAKTKDRLGYSRQVNALKLGQEALKFRLRWEQQEGEDHFPLLPGEDPE